jgi:hypothetical protein
VLDDPAVFEPEPVGLGASRRACGSAGRWCPLLETGQLRDGIDLAEVRDVLWNYLAIDHYERLVLDQGWSPDRYARWLAHAITSALCP